MHSHSSWIPIIPVSFVALVFGVTACSSPSDGGGSDSGTGEAASPATDGGSGESSTSDSGMMAAETGADAGGFMTVCTVLGMPGDCPPGENLTCRSYPNPPPGKDLCTRPCTAATAAVDCPPPSKGCGGMGLCAGP